MVKDLKDVDNLIFKLEETFNHLSNRVPIWATVSFIILGSLATGLIIVL